MASSISITSHRSIGEETDRLNLEEIEKSAEQRSLNSTGGGNLNAEINLGGENLAMDRYKKILGLNVNQRNAGCLKTDKKKRSRECRSKFTQGMVFQQVRGEESLELCYLLKIGEKVERRADQQCGAGPPSYI